MPLASQPRSTPALLLTAALALIASACATPKADVLVADGIRAQRSGALAVAKARYSAALELDPKVRGAAHNLAVIALSEGDVDRAVPLLQRELDAHSAAAEPRLLLAALALERAKAAEAEALAAPFAALSGGLPPTDAASLAVRQRARLLVVVARRVAGRPLEDVRAGWPAEVAALPTGGDGGRAREAIAATALAAGELEVAGAYTEGVDSAYARQVRAYAALAAGRGADAVAAALGDDTSAWAGLARLWSGAAPADAAAADAALASDDAATAVAGARLMASLRAESGDWAGALAALEARPGVSATRDGKLARVLALAQVGRLVEARAALVEVLREHPDDAGARALDEALSDAPR